MSDLFDDFNKIFKKDLIPIFVKYFNNPNNKIIENLNDLLDDPRILLGDIFEKFSKNKNNDINRANYTEIENITDVEEILDDEYEDLFKRLILIEENMIQLEKILRDKN